MDLYLRFAERTERCGGEGERGLDKRTPPGSSAEPDQPNLERRVEQPATPHFMEPTSERDMPLETHEESPRRDYSGDGCGLNTSPDAYLLH